MYVPKAPSRGGAEGPSPRGGEGRAPPPLGAEGQPRGPKNLVLYNKLKFNELNPFDYLAQLRDELNVDVSNITLLALAY
jgi:hypothetical protein